MANVSPGPALYVDFPGADPVPCEVFAAGPELYARFPRTDEDDGAEVPVTEMHGLFQTVRAIPA